MSNLIGGSHGCVKFRVLFNTSRGAGELIDMSPPWDLSKGHAKPVKRRGGYRNSSRRTPKKKTVWYSLTNRLGDRAGSVQGAGDKEVPPPGTDSLKSNSESENGVQPVVPLSILYQSVPKSMNDIKTKSKIKTSSGVKCRKIW